MDTKDNLDMAMVSKVIINEMFQVQPGETIAITADSGSDRETVDGLAKAAAEAGGIPLVMWIPKGRGDAQIGMADWPSEALTAALCEVEVWIEMTSTVLLYSDIWEKAMANNKKLRYLVIGGSSVASMKRVFTGYDIKVLGNLLHRIMDMAKKSNVVRITSSNGTDVSYEINLDYAFDIDDGDYSKPIFGTAPGYVNIVPKLGSMNGRIVFDVLMNADIFDNDNQVGFVMKDGIIKEVFGNKEAKKFQEFLASFDDPNMYKISHNMIGLNPGVRKLCGEIVEDERIWGGVDFGFGHTSPIDMPPHGQVAKSHFDGVVAKASIYLDDQLIVEEGNVCHPDLKELVEELLGQYA
ncbi:MAG: hypothetical protein HKN68_13290 [Saprospiraceae bacterium]|nr:hypothetical protein [Saprospiraceae bacterium]